MATTWPGSRIPFIDENGDPMVGAKLFFYDSGTTTPQVVYSDAGLSTAIDQPILANARGAFPIIFLNPTPGSYRQKLLEADDTMVFDDDDVDVPQSALFVPPTAGDTDPSLLVTTGMRMGYYGTSAPTGWVRAAGRTIGSATSGATERANADTEDLFLHLWTADSTLTVSGGRGGSAAGDWSANKAISLPDYRERVAAGLATMGNTDAGLVADSLVDGGETTSALGATAGADDVALIEAQMPSHLHALGTLKMPNHGHPARIASRSDSGPVQGTNGSLMLVTIGATSQAAYTGAVSDTLGQQIGGSGEVAITGAMATTGSGTAHTNMQPTLFELVIIKL